uniref:Uncharacterized protein n=1 Tax=Anguilla anguilla TaxID=7936 RepID=A0A0E9TYF6_ANGAN
MSASLRIEWNCVQFASEAFL